MKNSRISGPKAELYLRKQPGMTDIITSDLRRKLQRLKEIPREIPPVKGAFVAYLKDKGKDKLLSWTMHVKQRLVQELSVLSSSIDSRYQSLLDMELFQMNQKGPMAPISSDAITADVVPTLVKNSLLLPKKAAADKLVSAAWSIGTVHSKFMTLKSANLTSLNFETAWRSLPSSSLRGIPFLKRGKDIDDLICQLYGSELKSALNQFLSIDSLITTPGLRIQGSPKWDQAKVRLINIPSVNYQYLTNGIYQEIKRYLIKLPQMAGWLTPVERDKAIVNMWHRANARGYIPIPLDFRKFDSRMFPEFRTAVTHTLLNIFKDSKDLDTIREHYRKLYYNQYLCAPTKENVFNLFPVDNLLGSGIANTQADGSSLNLALQIYLCRHLGFEQPIDLGLTLGDDAVIFVPKEIFLKFGYEGILTEWSRALEPLNMEIHVKKKYPNPQIMFLQRLYVPENDIIGEYSLVRNVDSLVWAEHFRKPIEGITNHNALETIGQISTLNNSMQGTGKVSLKSVVHVLVDEWLKIDKALTYLAQLSSKTKHPSDSLFGFLVRASGGLDAIIHAMKLEQYDHKGLLELLANDSSKSFPIIDVIIERSLKISVEPVSLRKYYGLSDSQVGNLENMANEKVIEEMMDDA